MIFSFHNQLKIKTQNKSYVFYNTMLKSILEKLSKFEKFNEYISIGNGLPDSNIQDNFHLTNKVFTTQLSNKSFQSDISKGNLFAKYEFIVSKNKIKDTLITEIGLSDNNSNPTIFNYFSLITNDTPSGVYIQDEAVLEVTINLTINENNSFILTSGLNPFIEFLLGNGLNDVYLCTGTNYSENIRINREVNNNNQTLCVKNSNLSYNSLEISFEQELTDEEIDEILFISNNKVFARHNLKEFNTPTTSELTITSKDNYIIKIDEDIKNINSVFNNSTQTSEQNYFVSKYANSLGDKINIPFNNLFDSQTTRFLSKDARLIFFVIDDKVYGYINENFSITQLNTSEIHEDNILKIISFDKFVFILSKINPYISTYIIEDYTLKKCDNNFSDLSNINLIEKCLQVDITLCKNNKFILAIICEDKTALSTYFTFNDSNSFLTGNQIYNSKEFHYLLAMYKNNFCDGQIIYLKEGASSAECRIVTHSAEEVETDIYSSLAYYLTKNATRIYCKNRAIISEKSTSPSVIIYYYPQIYEYNLPLISDEVCDYISEDLNYIIQERTNKEFKIYNLVGYDTPEEFVTSISDLTNKDEIAGFEFMNDSLLVFLNNKESPVIGFNLKQNKTQIENVSNKNSDYLVSLTKYNKLGSDGKTIKFSLTSRINL